MLISVVQTHVGVLVNYPEIDGRVNKNRMRSNPCITVQKR